METEILVPDEPQEITPDTDLTDYKKLSNALRQDIRLASRELVKLRSWLYLVHVLKISQETIDVIENTLEHIDDALATLDCSEAFVNDSQSD